MGADDIWDDFVDLMERPIKETKDVKLLTLTSYSIDEAFIVCTSYL